MSGERLVALAEVLRPHGRRGEVRVSPLTDDPDRLAGVTDCVLWDPARDDRRPGRVTAARRRGDGVVVALAGVDDPQTARTLAGRLLAVPVAQARPPGPGRFYPWQLEGAVVTTEDGAEIGRVTGIERQPAHELWVVQGRERQHLIPAVPEIVRDVDLAAGRVVVRPPEGLLDL